MLMAEVIFPRQKPRREKVRTDNFVVLCPRIEDDIAFLVIEDTQLLVLFLAD